MQKEKKINISSFEQRFLNEIWENIHQISKDPNTTQLDKMRLTAFSILVMLDGEHAGIPPFYVKPIDEEGNEGEDIAGSLHDNFYSIVDL